jgi:hypothetical protein
MFLFLLPVPSMDHVVLITHLCHQKIVEDIKVNLVKNFPELKHRFAFIDPKHALGAQFPMVVVIVDLISAASNMTRLVDAATRATTKLMILWNLSSIVPTGKMNT